MKSKDKEFEKERKKHMDAIIKKFNLKKYIWNKQIEELTEDELAEVISITFASLGLELKKNKGIKNE